MVEIGLVGAIGGEIGFIRTVIEEEIWGGFTNYEQDTNQAMDNKGNLGRETHFDIIYSLFVLILVKVGGKVLQHKSFFSVLFSFMFS